MTAACQIIFSKEATSATTPIRLNSAPSTPSSATTVRKIVTSKFFTPKEPTSNNNSQQSSSSQPLTSASNSSSSSSEANARKKSLFSTLFSSQESSQEALNCGILAPSSSSAFCNNYVDDLTAALLRNEKLQRQHVQSKRNINNEECSEDNEDEEEPPSPTIFKTPSRSLSYDAAEEKVYLQKRHQEQTNSSNSSSTKKLPLSQPLPTSSSDLSLKKRKSSFVDKFIRKTPSSSQKSDLSQGLCSSQSSNASSSSSEQPQQTSQPLSQSIQPVTSIKNLFFYELSSDDDLEPAHKKVKQQQLVVTIVDSSEDEELVEFDQSVRTSASTTSTDFSEKNVFELFLSNDKDD